MMVVVLMAELLCSGHGIVGPKRISPTVGTVSLDSGDDNGLPSSVARVRAAVFRMQEDVASCLETSSATSSMAYVLRVRQDERDFRLAVKRISDWGDSWYSHSMVDSIFEDLESFRVNCSIAVQMVQQRPIANSRRSLLNGIQSDSRSAIATMNELVSQWYEREAQPQGTVQSDNYAGLFPVLLSLSLAAFSCLIAFKRIRSGLVRPEVHHTHIGVAGAKLKESSGSGEASGHCTNARDLGTQSARPSVKPQFKKRTSLRNTRRSGHRLHSEHGRFQSHKKSAALQEDSRRK